MPWPITPVHPYAKFAVTGQIWLSNIEIDLSHATEHTKDNLMGDSADAWNSSIFRPATLTLISVRGARTESDRQKAMQKSDLSKSELDKWFAEEDGGQSVSATSGKTATASTGESVLPARVSPTQEPYVRSHFRRSIGYRSSASQKDVRNAWS